MERKRILGLVLLSVVFVWSLVYANTTKTFMKIGRLWMVYEFDGAEGWARQAAWPGGYPISAFSGTEIWDANVRKTGTVAGCVNWTGPNGIHYDYWTSGAYRTYNYDYPTVWVGRTDLTTVYPVTQTEIQRWPPPRVIVNGKDIIPDGGDNYLKFHENAKIDPNLITERAVVSEWDYSMGVTLHRIAYGYATRKHQDYNLLDITLTNTGHIKGVQLPELANQVIHGFWYTETCNPWNSHSGRQFSFGADDAIGEYIQPWGADNHRLYLFYDGDNPNSPEKDWGDPSKDSRWVRLLSPAWIAEGPVYVQTSPSDKTDDLTQPRCTIIGDERDYDLGKKVHTMQEQYDMLFTEGKQWPLNTPHREVNAAIKRPSGYESIGPFELGPGESVEVIWVWAAGGINMKKCRELGGKAVAANFTGPVMDEIEKEFKTGRDSVLQTLQRAYWNVHGPKPEGHGRFDVPDPPRPPAEFRVEVNGPTIVLSWTDESKKEPDFDTGVPDFAGYRLYRAVGRRDSTYYLIYEGTDHKYVDRDVSLGHQYFYYLTAFDDGSQNWEDPGVSLESSRFWCWTGWAPEGVSPATAPIENKADMDNIKVVPNPYSVGGKTYPGEPDKILFTGLPPKCTIRIYSSSGSLVKTLDHTNGSGSEAWNLRTDYNQYIASDVYIYVVDAGSFGKHVGKFVVVR